VESTKKLEMHPELGKPIEDLIDYRDLGIRFGAGGYVLRYRIYDETIYIVHIRHYRESEYTLKRSKVIEAIN